MTLEQWQKSPELLAWAAKLFAEPNWQLLRQMLDTEHPKNYQRGNVITTTDRDLALGIIYGYDQYKNNLEQAGVAPMTFQPIEATYGADDSEIMSEKNRPTPKSKK